jgi:hypothetical protein
MKTHSPIDSGIGPSGSLILTISLLMLIGCAQKSTFLTSPVVPAAEGSVKVKRDKNSNYNIDLSVIRLADPKRLSPPKNVYVVWMETEEKGSQNIGQLKTSGGLFSNDLKSSLETVSSFKPKSFFITAEDKADIEYPGGLVVLNTSSK